MLPAIILLLAIVFFRIAPWIGGSEAVRDLAGYSPLMAFALCGGIFLPRRWALWFPVTAVLITHVVINLIAAQPVFHPYLVLTAVSVVAVSAAGIAVSKKASLAVILGASFLSTVLFHLVSNTVSFFMDPGYAKTLAGWWQCQTTGLPGYLPTWVFSLRQLGVSLALPPFFTPLSGSPCPVAALELLELLHLPPPDRRFLFPLKPAPLSRLMTTKSSVADVDHHVDPTDFAAAPVNVPLKPEDKIRFLTSMVRIRRFEEKAGAYYQKSAIGGFLHRYDGQEFIAVACASLMGPHDHMITAYRDHGHGLAVGMSMNECMAELFGRASGCSKGKGGSMHYFAPDKNYWGGHGIVGGQTPLGTGIAYYLKYKGLEGSCMCFMGDGAVNQGAYHESLNLAGLFNLPVIYVIENNGYSMGTSQSRSSAYKNCLAYRADGYDIVWDLINGWDIYEVRAKMQIAIERAHKESRPSVIEINTYRYNGHSVADGNAKIYRTPEEIERYKTHFDPIQVWKNRLIEERVLSEDDYAAIDKAANAEANASVEFSLAEPYPEFDDITRDVYFEVDEFSEAGRTGRHFFNG